MLTNNPRFWKNTWERHLTGYLSSPPRTGIFISTRFNKRIQTILEIACGSSRDSVYLAKKNYFVTATDFDENTIEYLKSRFINPHLKYVVADAFHLPFMDNQFDLVFHNGFFILFENNNDIIKLLKEQARVSNKYILILIHNQNNKNLLDIFSEKRKSDPLYDVRFFTVNEIMSIIKHSGIKTKNIKILKFGNRFDILYSENIGQHIPNIFFKHREKIVPFLYQFELWKNTERIACLIELNK